ncbi:LysR family transcriptional regulator [Microbispora hainanensis]|uniref:LysR family transcriptional regulator n=1 Tax=Microbispora hainanensis TaxID=568844 RepID=A0A544YYP4_9ACTN|nr:LysR family transcriptional regulator [Microbispora hainanensis]TQS21898.1 LysR family transcriptional regulator [Microbispora hainanensis]
MDRRQIEYFLAVVAHGSFTSAAHALNVTQPSLSHAVGALERELGVELFTRLGRGVRLTSAGEALLEPAQQIVRDFSRARASVQRVRGLQSGRLYIVALTTLAVDPLARMVGAFRNRHPGIDIRITDPEQAVAVAEMVRSGKCELGLADFSVPATGLRTLELPEQEMLAVLPPGSPYAERLTISEVAELDLVTTPQGTTTRTVVEQALAGASVPLRIAVETTHRAAIVPLVLAGAGAALLPRPMAEEAARQGTRIARIDPPVTRRVRLLWRSESLSPAAEAFVRLAESFAGRPAHDRR